MSEQKVPVSIEQRIIIKFLTRERVKPSEIFQRLTAQFGDQTLSRTRVFAWHKEFQEGRERVENEEHDRRPRSSITDENIQAVRDILEDDRRVTVSEIAEQVGVSYGSCQTIITEHLGLRKKEAFLASIVTCDETWVHHHTPESKQASMKWRRKGETAPVNAKTRLSAGKVLATVFFDYRGVLLIDFLHERRTINAAYYCELLTQVRAAYRSKRRNQPIRDVILLHDNARPHTAALTVQKLEEMHWTPLDHPPYSPDLSPCDFHLFGPLKEALGGQRFEDDEGVEGFVRNWLQTQPSSFFDAGIKKLPIRWEKCVTKAGDYVEK